ncbi:hypothetical protein [Microcoleus anatoxicus]
MTSFLPEVYEISPNMMVEQAVEACSLAAFEEMSLKESNPVSLSAKE